jgi:hypothetical protein
MTRQAEAAKTMRLGALGLAKEAADKDTGRRECKVSLADIAQRTSNKSMFLDLAVSFATASLPSPDNGQQCR